MADERDVSKVTRDERQVAVDKYYIQRADKERLAKSKRLLTLKKKNNLVGLLLVGSVLGIYGYTIMSVRQNKMMEAFDKSPE